MPTEAESFLAVEEAVSKLLDNLESLRKEMEVYKTGRIQLEEQLQDMRRFTERIKALTETSQEVLGALGRIGTQEILERTTELVALSRTMLSKVEDTATRSLESIAGIEASSKKSGADLLARMELLESKTADAIAKSEVSHNERLTSLQNLLHAEIANMRSGMHQKVKRLIIVSILSPLVACMITILIILVFGK